ncbi:MAG: TonB-dependent receptor [Bacteroidales bacterium]|nr:TonB-dependent receptor [Bacteroidales bacterium]
MRKVLSTDFWRGLCAAVLLLVPVLAGGQAQTVKGVVRDASGEPVIGAVVMVEGTNNAATTDIDGAYVIRADANATLLFNCLGYKDVREVVGQRAVIDVILEDDTTVLDEAVAIGYSTIKKRDLTGSVASVGTDAIQRAIPTSADQVLQGRAAGVQMTQNSGLPGGGTSIRIRGVNSLNSSNEPIIVIDGVIIDAQTGTSTDNALSSINPNDIETMDILKDASATAIYGAQGANGVILITTKRGKAGHTQITFDAQGGIQMMPKFLDLMDLPMYARHYNEFAALRGATQHDEYADPSFLSAGTDWQRELFKTAPMQQYNLSVTGGNEKTTYAVTAGYLDQDGIAYGSGFERLTLRTNMDIQAKDWLKIGASAAVSRSVQDFNSLAGNSEGLIQVALKQSPAVSARSIDGGYDGPEDANFAQSNPIGLANLLENYNKKAGVRSNIYAEITPLKGLTWRTEFSSDLNVGNTYNFTPTYKFGSIYNSENSRQQQKNYSEYWAFRNLLTYNNTFGRHTLNTMLGQEITSSHWEYILARRLNGPDNLHDISAGDQTTSQTNGSSGDGKFSSFFGRVFYSFDDRYLLTATLRADGSSNFARGHRWGLFPSAALAWRISEESFIKDNIPAINNLKLRFGYGKVGNSNVPAMAWQATLSTVTTNWGNGYLTGRIPNELLTWEKTDSYNVGLDLGLWQDRLSIVFDAYLKRTNDLLMEAVLPAYVGTAGQGSASAPYGNMGAISNKGFEFTVNTVNVSKRNFSWTSSLVFSLNKNRVEALNVKDGTIDKTYQVSGTNTVVTRTQVGSSIGDFYGYEVVGRIMDANDIFDQEGNIKVALPTTVINRDSGVWVGDWLFRDVDGNGIIDENDRKNLGSPLPLFTGGFGNTFTIGNVDLNVYLTYSYGNKVMNWLRVTMDNPNTTTNKFRRAADYAKIGLINEKGSDTDIYNVYVESAGRWMPRMSAGDVNDNDRISSLYIEDGSYLRVQNVSLAYRFPHKWMEKLRIASCRLSLNIQNLYTLTRYTGFDPEVGMTMDQYSTNGQDALMNGIDTGRYPTPRIFTLGLNVGF